MSYYLAIVSPLDSPLYEAQFATSKPSTSTSNPSSSTGFPSWSTLTSAGSAPASSSATTTASSSTVPGSSPLRPTPTRDLFPTALLGGQNAQSRSGSNSERHVLQMIAHSSLDVVEDLMVGNGSLYLRAVDKFNEWIVSAFVAPCVKFILLHDMKNEEGIRLFFLDVWDCYVKTLMNPFHTVTTPMQSVIFETKIRASARRHL